MISGLRKTFSQQQDQVKTIQDVNNRGLFVCHKAALFKKRDYWEKETWWDCIGHIAEGRIKKKRISQQDLLLCYLFAIAIDPKRSTEDKQSLFSKCQKKEDSYYALGKKLPAVMSTHILRYCTSDVWEGSCKQILKYRDISNYEKFFIKWIKQTVVNKWTQKEKEAFLDRLFSFLPSKTSDEILYYSLMYLSADLQKQLSECCPHLLAERIENLKKEVAQFGQFTLLGLESKKEPVQIPFSGNQRQYFLNWFYNNALDQNDATFVAIDFNKQDWKSFPPSICPYAMKWMTAAANSPSCSPQFWLFFHCASHAIEKEDGWKKISSKAYQEFFKALTGKILAKFFNAFPDALQNKIVENLTIEPKSWLQNILENSKDDFDSVTFSISRIFTLISKKRSSQAAIAAIFDIKQNNNAFMLTTFCSLSMDHREEILRHILFDRAAGIETLSRWVELWLQKGGPLRPYTKEILAKDFYTLLQKVDPTVASELKDALASTNDQEMINSLLPVGIDFADPLVRQSKAIKNLKHHFLATQISDRNRENFVRSLRKDLEGEEEASLWLPKLFKQLPKQTWPLIFVYFAKELRASSWMPDRKEWVSIAQETLPQMIDNPCLENQRRALTCLPDDAMESLYQVANDTQSIKAVIQKFIEKAPPAQVIPVMNLLGRNNFWVIRMDLINS